MNPMFQASPASPRFKRVVEGACIAVLAFFAAVVIFLVVRAAPVLSSGKATERELSTLTSGAVSSLPEYLGPLIFGTLLSSLVALAIAIPFAVGTALVISQFARGKVRTALSAVIDLLAAIPSVIYGLWGVLVLVPASGGFWSFLNRYLGWIPLFSGTVAVPARTMASAGVVLAIMIIPIIATISRDAFLQVPSQDKEAALALGATRWEMILAVVMPAGRSAVMASILLGLGRALGETMAVLMILSPAASYSVHLLEATQNQTIAANIAAQFPEADENGVGLLIATGVVLFAISFVVNAIAQKVVAHGEKSEKHEASQRHAAAENGEGNPA